MMFKKVALLALCASTLIGAKPAPPPSTSNPEIAYVNISGGSRRHYQLRVANEDGTGAATLYSSRDVGQMMPHMGPAADRTIVLIQGGRVSLVRYNVSSTGTTFHSIEPLFTINTAVGAQRVDFSPNGKDIVWWDRPINTLKIFNLDTRTSRSLIQLASEPHNFAFNRDGTAVLFLDHVTDSDAILKSVPLAGGDATEVGLRGDFWGVESAHGSDALILTRGVNHKTSQLEYYATPASGPDNLATGYVPSIKCDDSTAIYQQVNADGSVSLLRVDLASGAGFTTSTKGNYWPDYVGC